MSILVALPDLQPGWHGGQRYLSTIREGMNILERKGIVEVVKSPRIIRDENKPRSKYGPLNAAIHGADLIRGICALNVPRPISSLSVRSLAWIPDLQDVERPEFFSTRELDRRAKLRDKYRRNHNALFFSSNHAMEIFKSMNFPDGLIAGVVRFSMDLGFARRDLEVNFQCKGCEEFGYFYLPNQWWIHKNHEWALNSFREYQSSGGKKHLVLTGIESDPRWPNYSAEKILAQMGLVGVHKLGFVSRSDQNFFYENASAVIQPSSYEGWSTTIEESVSLGIPVIASNIPSNIEQLAGCPDSILVQIHSTSELAKALFNPPIRLELGEVQKRNTYRNARFIDDLRQVIEKGDLQTRSVK
jgi:glycosyltransferase involved in cell wall biosynthesis